MSDGDFYVPFFSFAGESSILLTFPLKDKGRFASVPGLLLCPAFLHMEGLTACSFLPAFGAVPTLGMAGIFCFHKSHMNSKELSRAILHHTSNLYKLHIKVIYWGYEGLLYIEIAAVWYMPKEKVWTKMMTTHYLFEPNHNVKKEA